MWWAWLLACTPEPDRPGRSVPESQVDWVEGRLCEPDRGRVTHAIPTFGQKLYTSGFAVLDADDDGALDLFVPGYPDQVLLLQREGVFEPAPEGTLPPQGDRVVGASTADYDGDGDFDVVVFADEAPDALLRNDGGTFADVTVESGFAEGDEGARSMAATWGDLDADGILDVVVAGWAAESPTMVRRGLGDGTFEDISDQFPQRLHEGITFLVTLVDLEADGRPDLFVSNDHPRVEQSFVVANRDTGYEIDTPAGFERRFEGMGLVAVDIDHDGLLDIAGSSYRTISVLRGFEDPQSGEFLFLESHQALGIRGQAGQDFGWGLDVGDLDNDGDNDLIVTFGHWDFPQDNALAQPDVIFEQVELGVFERARTGDAGPSRGVLWVDLDRDGQLDTVKRMLDGRLLIDWGACEPGAWIEVELWDPESQNHFGVGATVTVEAGDRSWSRIIDAGGRSMFSGGPPEVHFGLGEVEEIDRLVVDWPDGGRTVYRDLPVRGRVTVVREP